MYGIERQVGWAGTGKLVLSEKGHAIFGRLILGYAVIRHVELAWCFHV